MDKRQINATALIGTLCEVPTLGFETVNDARGNYVSAQAHCPRTFKTSFSRPTWLVSLDHQLTPDILIYAKVATGYRSGGENEAGIVDVESFAAFSPETNLEYEAGIKSEFFERRLRLNLDGYRDQYSNLQVATNIVGADGTFATVESNAATATVLGMEAEVDVSISRALSLHASAAYTDAKYDKFLDSTRGDRSREPFQVPRWTWSLSGKYVRPTYFGDLLVELDYSWKSSTDLAGRSAAVNQVTQAAYGLLNARVNLHLNAWDVDVALFGKNIAGVKFNDQALSVEAIGFNFLYPGSPAVFGIEVIKKFGG